MIAVINNSILRGEITAPQSKSAAHRALICSYLAGAEIKAEPSDDITATENALKSLDSGVADCNESGSTLRFIVPVAAALGKSVTFTGKGRLPERPISDYLRLLPEHNVICESEGGLPLEISGKLSPGVFELAGNVSSQYVTGLLLALPLLDGDSEIVLTSPLQSKPYVDMTLQTMNSFGVFVKETKTGYKIKGNQKYKPAEASIEGDWSQAAFFLAAGAIGGDVTVKGVDMNSAQGDKEVVNILKRFGAEIYADNHSVRAVKSKLRGTQIDVSDIPDTVPALAVVAAFAEGETRITGGERLRIKESDRIKSVVSNLKKMGVKAEETADGMMITGGGVKGAALDGFNDHRIVMAFSIAALYAEGKSEISDARSISKSYPKFFEDYNLLGGKADVINDRK